MTPLPSPGPVSPFRTPRQRDRRQALGPVLATLVGAIGRPGEVALLRGALEEGLRSVVPARSVQLRDRDARWAQKAEPTGLEMVAFEVPGADAGTAAVLEATFDPGCRLGEWDIQTLGLAAHLASLVLEIERARLPIARAGMNAPARSARDRPATLVGSTPALQALRAAIQRVAGTDFTILIEGESGVGKELVARQVHELSHRRDGPFVAINCAALVETLLEAELFGIEERTATGVRGRRGKFELADGGTLFLDEVADLSMSAQAKLLRAIQELSVERVGATGSQRVDIRIVAATNRSLRDMVDRRLFRPDLFYRLAGVDLRVPTLRERRADILALARHVLDRHQETRRLTLSEPAAGALVTYDWPGNVRELERVMERAIALAETPVIGLDDLPPAVRGEYAAALAPSVERQESLRTWARRYTRVVLERVGGNKRKAARILGISTHTLQAYLRDAPVPDPPETDGWAPESVEAPSA